MVNGIPIMRRGFTLIELMIVVSIIGILAAIAIPGFLEYIKKSKTSEAKINLDSIQKGALTYFQAEHYFDSGMSTRTRIYPEAETVIGIGHPASDETVAQKYPPSEIEDTLKTAPWVDLKFTLTTPYYFYYLYNSNNDTSPSFQSSASASLNEPCDAIYIVEGRSDGSASGILDMSGDASKCNVAVAP